MKDTILVDFVGVIRHRSGDEIERSERIAGVAKGTLLPVAFSNVFNYIIEVVSKYQGFMLYGQ